VWLIKVNFVKSAIPYRASVYVAGRHCPLIGTELYLFATEAHVCEQLALTAERPGDEPVTYESQVQRYSLTVTIPGHTRRGAVETSNAEEQISKSHSVHFGYDCNRLFTALVCILKMFILRTNSPCLSVTVY